MYFGYSIRNSIEGMSDSRTQQTLNRQVFLSDILDIADIEYEMETIPAHREDVKDLPPSPFKWDSLS